MNTHLSLDGTCEACDRVGSVIRFRKYNLCSQCITEYRKYVKANRCKHNYFLYKVDEDIGPVYQCSKCEEFYYGELKAKIK